VRRTRPDVSTRARLLQLPRRATPQAAVRTKDGERVAGCIEVAPRAGQPEAGELVREVSNAGAQDRQIDREQPANFALDGKDGRRDLRAKGGQSGNEKDVRSSWGRTTIRLTGTAATVRAHSVVPPPPSRSRKDDGTIIRN
jgi:hypothetical protein